jgi:hypothetical protein
MSEIKFPLTLIGVAVAIYVGYGVFVFVAFEGNPAESNARILLLLLSVFLSAITYVLGIACFLVARILGTNFGTLTSASVKLIAATLFPTAIGLLFFTLLEPISQGFAILGGIAVVILLFVFFLKFLFDS